MATKVSKKEAKGFEFRFASGQNRSGAFAAKYPWDEWFDGELWLLERHDGPANNKGTIEQPTTVRDYGVPVDAMFPKTKTAARHRYKIVQLSKRGDDGQLLPNGGIYVKAREMTADERAEEDMLRAEEKAAKKAANGTDAGTVPMSQVG